MCWAGNGTTHRNYSAQPKKGGRAVWVQGPSLQDVLSTENKAGGVGWLVNATFCVKGPSVCVCFQKKRKHFKKSRRPGFKWKNKERAQTAKEEVSFLCESLSIWL